MGHGIDFGEELAVNHRLIRRAAADPAASPVEFRAALRGHLRLLRAYVLPALSGNVASGPRAAALDTLLLDALDRESATAGPPGEVLVGLVEEQFAWESRSLLPLLEAEVTWIVLEDLAERARRVRRETAPGLSR
jgi:hypothetical protein